ncbi:MAG: hypothetical protein CGW95_03160 [Phenylobacterium zucineum]|nr:MAG: hypothetical protein CGW95_03160 [Phenylobacterium zucineum]
MSLNPIEDVSRTLATLAEQAVTRVKGGPPGPFSNLPRSDAQGAKASEDPVSIRTLRAQVLAQAGRDAAVRQDGLGRLMAELADALKGADLSKQIVSEIDRVLSRLAPLNETVNGADVENALRHSGLMLEVDLVRHPNDIPQDLKSALLSLRHALATPPGPRRTTGAVRPPPPYFGGPISGQPAYSQIPDPDVSTEARQQRLADAVDGALARIELEQIASLPQKESDPTVWRFETPVATPQGTTIAQCEIQREDHGHRTGASSLAIWRVRFALNLDPFGPIEAHLHLTGIHLGVALWVQKREAADILTAQASNLSGGLAGTGLEVAVAVYHGTPGAAPTPTGRLLDTAI